MPAGFLQAWHSLPQAEIKTTPSCTTCSMTTTNKKRVTLFLNSKLLKQAKVQSVVEGISLTSLAERALVRYLPKEIIIEKVEIKADSNPKTQI